MLHIKTVESRTFSLLISPIEDVNGIRFYSSAVPHAITYFVDAEESETPVSFKKQTWESVKMGIRKAVSDYLR
ncbi:MAG TPA: hypothetical protein VIK10_05420 [Prolixibacteraceae bacterium]